MARPSRQEDSINMDEIQGGQRQRELEPPIDDLSKLERLDEESILRELYKRYKHQLIYTYVGDVTIALNPFQPLPSMYNEKLHMKFTNMKSRSDFAPHIYWVADRSYQRMRESGADQSILISGESGAGKTETTKYIIRHIAYLCRTHYDNLCDKLIEVNPLLEAFGNARTVLNANSSRFGKYIEMHFSTQGVLKGARIYEYMLEKSRVIHHSQGERNFRIFYYFLAGISPEENDLLRLRAPEFYRIMFSPEEFKDPNHTLFPNSQARKACEMENHKIFQTMAHIGLTHEEIWFIKTVLAAILHVTNITFTETPDDHNDGVRIKDLDPFQHAALLLGLQEEVLEEMLLKNVFGSESIQRSNTYKQACDVRDALAKALYQRTFSWLVSKINEHLCPDGKPLSCRSIGVLDMSGFENFRRNSLEQLLINSANERLQFFFNEHLFSQEIEALKREDIDWTKIHYQNNLNIIDLFFGGTSRGSGKAGVLDLINEHTALSQGTDRALVQQMHEQLSWNEHYERPPGDTPTFTIQHFAGKVQYDVQGFLEKNRDGLTKSLMMHMMGSKSPALASMFQVQADRTGSISRGRRQSLFSTMESHYGTSFPGTRKKNLTVTKKFQNSLQELVDKLNSTMPLFVRCVKPNNKAAPFEWNNDMVTQQLRYNGLLEIAKIRKIGFPVRILHKDFLKKYSVVAFRALPETRDSLQLILNSVGIEDAEIGTEKVFLKEWHKDKLDARLAAMRRAVWSVERRGVRERFRKLVYRALKELPRPPKTQYSSAATLPLPGRPDLNHPDVGANPQGQGAQQSSLNQPGIIEEDIILPQENWDVMRSIPVERVSASENFEVILRIAKVLLYGLFSVLFLASLVTSKLSFFMLTARLGSFTQHEDSVDTVASRRQRNTVVTLLVICLCIPHALTFLTYTLKSLFGSQQWPSLLCILQILAIESVHTFGLCILVFKVLPHMDVMRGILTLTAVGVVLTFCKLIFGKRTLWPRSKLQPEPTEEKNREEKEKERRREEQEILSERRKNILWYFANFVVLAIQCSAVIVLGQGTFMFYQTPAQPTVAAQTAPQGNDTLAGPTSGSTGSANVHFRAVASPSGPQWQWEVVVALVMLSCKWWENFVDKNLVLWHGRDNQKSKMGSSRGNSKMTQPEEPRARLAIPLQNFKAIMHKLRQKASIFTSIWSCAIIITYPLIFLGPFQFDIYIPQKRKSHATQILIDYAPAVFQACSSLLGYIIGVCICKLCMQRFCFNLPLLLATPLSLVLVLLRCNGTLMVNERYFWLCPELFSGSGGTPLRVETYWQLAVMALWWLSQFFLASYLWSPEQNRMDAGDKLFISPHYSSLLLEQSMLYNRRRHDDEVRWSSQGYFWYRCRDVDSAYGSVVSGSEGDELSEGSRNNREIIPRIYACATMWHETKNEMTQLMKSIFRMDKHQNIRRNQREVIGIHDPDYFEFETHILFDDAMELTDDEEFVPNQFVGQFMGVVNDAASSVHGCAIALEDPIRTPTPYGGRLTWNLPGGTKLILHLKDKNKIRHKKRWSQCMYMYYLLAYRLLGMSDNAIWQVREKKNFHKGPFFQHIPEELVHQADHTYILALDGDVDFKPGAVQLLVDLLKKNKNVGAACGRIHPIGTGPVIWYQVFEYAVAHWLQKAAEHVFGCVLCSPGCFSLFRGSCLMDDNVMARYMSKAEEAIEFVQYDQGEDRWLCTLLLQQGYRVEYSAASDALTYAPESPQEFYTQRRRWGPSTMANIMDLLSSFQSTVRKNPNISYLYIVYQALLFASSILGPATLIMMIAGSYNTILGTDLWQSYMLSIGPAIFFTIVCFTTRGDTQIMVALVLSAFYAIVMMVVIVGTITNGITESIFSPNVIFLSILVIFFLAAAIMHPQEFFCIAPGLLYFICIPSGYLLLTIYSLCNLHVVSWGTREVPRKKTREEMQKEKEEEEERRRLAAQKKKGLLNWLGLDAFMESLKEFYSTMLPQRNHTDKLAEALSHIERTMGRIDSKLGPTGAAADSTVIYQRETEEAQPAKKKNELQRALDAKRTSAEALPVEPAPALPVIRKPKRDELKNPAWLEAQMVGKGRIEELDEKELVFWQQLVRVHLHPLDKDAKKEKEIQSALMRLRNNVVFVFMMMNVLWMVITFQMQLLKDTLEEKVFIPIPRADNGEEERFEPLGLAFLVFYATVLIMQFLGAIVHRVGTFMHLISSTKINWPWERHLMGENDLKVALQLTEELNRIPPIPDYDLDEDDNIYASLTTPGHSEKEYGDSRDGSRGQHRRRRRKPDDRRYHRRRVPGGRIRVHGETLSHNFQRRVERMRRDFDQEGYGGGDSSHHGENPRDMHRRHRRDAGGRGRDQGGDYGRHHGRDQPRERHKHMYRTIREAMHRHRKHRPHHQRDPYGPHGYDNRGYTRY